MYIKIKKQKQGELIVNQANWIGFCDNWNLLVPDMKFLVHKVQAKRSLQTSFLALNRHAASAGCREEGRNTNVATVRLKDPPENQNPPRLAWTLATWHREKLLPNVHSNAFTQTTIFLFSLASVFYLSQDISVTPPEFIVPLLGGGSLLPQEYPLQVSASPRYSGFSAVGVTNPFTCWGTPPSLSRASGPLV